MAVITRDLVAGMVAAGASARCAESISPRFKVGDRIRTRNLNTGGHTRLPRYARGRIGIIAISHGVFAFPDAMAHGGGEAGQNMYAVKFRATELWGSSASPRDSIYIDLFDAYLDPA